MTTTTLEDAEGKTFQTDKSFSHKMPFDKTEPWTVVERIVEGGPFSGKDAVVVEQDGEKYELEDDMTKKLRQLVENDHTEEVRE